MIFSRYTDLELIRIKRNLEILCGRLGAGPETTGQQQIRAIKVELARRVRNTPIRVVVEEEK